MKAYLADPRQLLQVNGTFHGYLWLVNRDDYRQRAVSFIISDASALAPRPARLLSPETPTVVRCGRYTITDYHRNVLPIGSPTTAYDKTD